MREKTEKVYEPPSALIHTEAGTKARPDACPLCPGPSCGPQVRVATASPYSPSPFGGNGEIRTHLCLASEPCFFLDMSFSSQTCVLVQMAPDYDHLTLMQKVEVFEHAVNNTAGDDLAKLLWLKSPSSEVWRSCPTNLPSGQEGCLLLCARWTCPVTSSCRWWVVL